MLKKDILDLINSFEAETWKYADNDKLDIDMQYIYDIEKEIQNAHEESLKPLYDKLLSMIGIIRYKYGFESIVISSNPKLADLKMITNNISLSSNDIINQYNYVSTIYNDYISKCKNIDFIENKYANIQGKEGLYLTIESLKSLISNESYRKLLDTNKINEILIDCIKLNNGIISAQKLESKYKDIIKQIWECSLSNKVDENGNFRILFSNISGGNLRDQANMLINRPSQSSCSMISSNFIATYGDKTRNIGFIYSNNSEIIMASAYDLGSNVFKEGTVNKEKGTTIATPQVLEKIGKDRTLKNGEDIYSSSCYNEILVNAKPCGIVVLGLGEKDLNIDYQEAQMLSLEMNLPIYYIDTLQYKNNLSETDKNDIAFHSLMSYLGMSREALLQQIEQNNGYNEIYNLISIYKEPIANIFLTLKKEGNLSKDSMCQMMNNIIDISKINYKSR